MTQQSDIVPAESVHTVSPTNTKSDAQIQHSSQEKKDELSTGVFVAPGSSSSDLEGLKANRDKILAEKKKLAERLRDIQQRYGDADPANMQMLQHENAKLKRENDALIRRQQDAQTALTTARYEQEFLPLALQSGVKPEALPDVMHRAQQAGWGLSQSGQLVFGSKGKTQKRASTWLNKLAAEAPHLFQASAGGGAGHGSMSSKSAVSRQRKADFTRTTRDELQRIASGEVKVSL